MISCFYFWCNIFTIVIFNSSEDEYCAINKEVDDAKLFPSQLIGIRRIVDFCNNLPNLQLFLRVHPNLIGVNYSYHTDLYKIEGNDFHIIPPESSVSSYSLMDSADVIIVFGSTMGIEAAYWGKPVINLAYALYSPLDITYLPKTEKELWDLIEKDNINNKNPENCLKYGFYYMSDKHEHFKHIDVRWVKYNIKGHVTKAMSYLKFCGSPILYRYLKRNILDKMFKIDLI